MNDQPIDELATVTLKRIETTLHSIDDGLRGIERDIGALKGSVSRLPTARQVLFSGTGLLSFGFLLVHLGLS